jgi:hypothetical protein
MAGEESSNREGRSNRAAPLIPSPLEGEGRVGGRPLTPSIHHENGSPLRRVKLDLLS